MAIEVNDGDWAVRRINTSQQRKGDGVVSAEGYDSWEGLALERRASNVSIGGRLAGEDRVMPVFDLLQGICVVVAD